MRCSFDIRMRKTLFLFVTIFLGSASGCMSAAIEKENADNWKVVIDKYFNGYRLMEMTNLSKDAQEYFSSHYFNARPSIVQGDFDGNGFSDLAVLLKKNHGGNDMIFAIFLQTNEHKLLLEYKFDIGATKEDLYIDLIEQGKYINQTDSIDSPSEKVFLENKAIELVSYGKTAVVYYWDTKNKKFSAVQTKD